MWLFDHVFSGFDATHPDGGAEAFLCSRRPLLGRSDQSAFLTTDADGLAFARDEQGRKRVLTSVYPKPCGGANILVCGLPTPLAANLSERIIAEPARLPYRLRAEPGISLSSTCWRTLTGKNILILFRTDSVMDRPTKVTITPKDNLSAIPLLVGACRWTPPYLLMPPQSHAWFLLP